MRASKGMRFQATVVLTADEVARLPRSVGDDNPLHHDEAVARASPYRQRIASGPHTSALMMATTASHFSCSGAMVGLETSSLSSVRVAPARVRAGRPPATYNRGFMRPLSPARPLSAVCGASALRAGSSFAGCMGWR